MNIQYELKIAKEISIKAGHKILEYYNDKNNLLQTKKDGNFESPLTKADLEANKIIVNKLRNEFSTYDILTEEEKDDKSRLDNDYVWIIDPLDGTKEFINKNGEFTVNIALAYKGESILGVIYVPVKRDLFYASKDNGAYYEKEGKVEKINVSNNFNISDMILVTSRSHSGEKEKKIIKFFKETISRGSSLKGCMVAKGDADVYFRFGNTSEWDICAMNCIVNEAGGTMTDLDGKNIKYNKPEILINGFIVSNGNIHDILVELGKK